MYFLHDLRQIFIYRKSGKIRVICIVVNKYKNDKLAVILDLSIDTITPLIQSGTA